MINKLKILLQQDKSFAKNVQNLLDTYLQEEEHKLQRLAIDALLVPSQHYSAVVQLGRVTLLREFSMQIKLILGEQKNV